MLALHRVLSIIADGVEASFRTSPLASLVVLVLFALALLFSGQYLRYKLKTARMRHTERMRVLELMGQISQNGGRFLAQRSMLRRVLNGVRSWKIFSYLR